MIQIYLHTAFSSSNYMPTSGLAVGNRTKWHSDTSIYGFLAMGHDKLLISAVGNTSDANKLWIKNAVGGFPSLIVDGVNLGVELQTHVTFGWMN